MSRFRPNIGPTGRILRGLAGLALLIGGLFALPTVRWLGVLLLASSAFVLFESLRGWCALRACGIKTRF